MYECQFCGRHFELKSARTQHEKYHCSNNPNKQQISLYKEHKKVSCALCGKFFDVANIRRHEASCGKKADKYQVNHDGLNCIFCDKLCKNKNSLAQHELRCKENPDRKNFNSFDSFNSELKEMRDTIGLNKSTCARIAKSAKTLRARYKSGEIIPASKGKPGTFLGRRHSEESKAKTRASTLKYIENTFGSVQTRYNINACKYIDYLNTRFNWNLQHAENGGEFRVCNYFLDGYDSENSIAFEYDEPRHYIDVDNNVLCDRDIFRMKTIIDELNCRFIRYNEKLNLLYEIDKEQNWHIL